MEHEKEYSQICDGLEKIIKNTGEVLEGNCMYQHHSFDTIDSLLNKRKNYQKAAKDKKFICEIGFNAGHSFLTMLLVNPGAHYILFDLGEHKYSRPCFEYLKNHFPQTKMEIFWGDSRVTLKEYYTKHPEMIFDLVHVDGGHQPEVYTVDWDNTLKITTPGSLMIFDDTERERIYNFVEGEINKNIVMETIGFEKTHVLEHRILIRNKSGHKTPRTNLGVLERITYGVLNGKLSFFIRRFLYNVHNNYGLLGKMERIIFAYNRRINY